MIAIEQLNYLKNKKGLSTEIYDIALSMVLYLDSYNFSVSVDEELYTSFRSLWIDVANRNVPLGQRIQKFSVKIRNSGMLGLIGNVKILNDVHYIQFNSENLAPMTTELKKNANLHF